MMSEKYIEDPAQSEFDALEFPSMTPASLARKFGPGMMLMMTGIGTSHLVTAPVAGGDLDRTTAHHDQDTQAL